MTTSHNNEQKLKTIYAYLDRPVFLKLFCSISPLSSLATQNPLKGAIPPTLRTTEVDILFFL